MATDPLHRPNPKVTPTRLSERRSVGPGDGDQQQESCEDDRDSEVAGSDPPLYIPALHCLDSRQPYRRAVPTTWAGGSAQSIITLNRLRLQSVNWLNRIACAEGRIRRKLQHKLSPAQLGGPLLHEEPAAVQLDQRGGNGQAEAGTT